MEHFQPDYTNILQAANNVKADRIPLYEHIISEGIMEKILDIKFANLIKGNSDDKREFFRNYNSFFKKMGYDTVSFERCIGSVMPGGGALESNTDGVIKNREDFDNYPWKEIPARFFKQYSDEFKLLGEELPSGMKAVGGPGNGIFECVQELVGYTQLCYIAADDPELYNDLFDKVGDTMLEIWNTFLNRFADIYVVCRFGDDLGFKTSTLLSPNDIRTNIIPQYKRVIEVIHSYNKPFLLHSCGNIFDVMSDLIKVGIDAKHSNEDQIAPFSMWVNKYGDQIGNFGGIDTDILCRKSEEEIGLYVKDVLNYVEKFGSGGFALGSGNSIPDYVPVSGYLAMVEPIRKMRS